MSTISLLFILILSFTVFSEASLQVGAAWAMRGRNAQHLSISPFIGPNATYSTSAYVSSYATTGIISGSPIFDNQDNVIFGSQNKYLYKIGYDLSFVASYQTAGLIQSTPMVDNSGNIYFSVILRFNFILFSN